MRKLFPIFFIFLLIVLVILMIFFYRTDEYTVAPQDFLDEELIAQVASSELSQEEMDGLLLMREEEKLARDVYSALYDLWNVPIFSNIAMSEQTHTDAVKALLDRYGLDEDVAGEFKNKELQDLYNELVESGSSSVESALVVGATIEDLDIYDLNTLLNSVDNEDIEIVYNNLIRGSENHMRAFIRQLESRGSSYDVQYISQSELDHILAQ